MNVKSYCDDCGKPMEKAHRIHKGLRYCSTCYAREFERRMCSKCGNLAMLYKNDHEAICRRCQRNKPCARCGKAEYKIGKITPYGPVCKTCLPYFKETKACGLCGILSTRLTRVSRLGIDVPVCPKCARRDIATCQMCRRHRLLSEMPDGRMLCKACLEKGEVPCPTCGGTMPAGYGSVCEACYWKEVFRKRLVIDQATFSAPGVGQAFDEFGNWLALEVGNQKAALFIHRYLPFFLEIQKQWKRIPDYAELLGYFGAEGLRRVRVPMRWLGKAKDILPDATAREQDSDRRRIEAIMASIPIETEAAKVLAAYKDNLMNRIKGGKATVRSARLAIRPAASLLLIADSTGSKLPDQAALNRYLLEAPGQMAAITGFVNFLNEKHELALSLKVDKKLVSMARKKNLEKELMALIREKGNGEESRKRWLSVALAYFHGLSRKAGKSVKNEDIVNAVDGGEIVTWGKAKYWLPEMLKLTRW